MAFVQVILQEDLQNLGKSGDLVRVRPGYARNFLVPRALAVPATARNVTRVEHEQRAATARAAKAKADAVNVQGTLGALTVRLQRKVGDEDRLFGSVTTKDIAEALAAAGHVVDKKKIALGDPIRTIGTHEVTVKLAADVVATIKVEVIKQ